MAAPMLSGGRTSGWDEGMDGRMQKMSREEGYDGSPDPFCS